jgi:hypothetical protein
MSTLPITRIYDSLLRKLRPSSNEPESVKIRPSQPTVWACWACTYLNTKGFHCQICLSRRLTQEDQDANADAVAAPAYEDLSKDDGTEYNDDGKDYNEESVTSPKDDDENNASPEYTSTDPTARKRVPTLRESTNTSSTFRTPEPSTRCKTAPDLAKKGSKVPTCRKLFAVEESTPPTTTP